MNEQRKLNYHQRSNKASIDRSSGQILSSSPNIKASRLHEYLQNKNFEIVNLNLPKDRDSADEEFKNTIQSMNEQEGVNYMGDYTGHLFKTAIKRDTIINNNAISYKKATESLLMVIDKSLSHFKSTEFKFKNEDKKPIVKILKEDYDKLREENEGLIQENKKLRKELKNSENNSNSNNNVNVNKVKIFIN
jgi:hypothetical protein